MANRLMKDVQHHKLMQKKVTMRYHFLPYFCAPIAPYIAPIIAFIENFIKISSLV